MAAGVLVGIGALLWKPGERAASQRKPTTKCVRDKVVPVIKICGQRVEYLNPDGSVVYIGSTKDLQASHSHVREEAK